MHKWLLSCVTLFCSALQAEPLYWHASKGALDFHIIGSVHVGDDSMYPLPSPISAALEHSDGLIVETDIHNGQAVSYPQQTISSAEILSAEQKQELSGIANLLSLNEAQLLASPPWASALTIQMRQIEYLGFQASKGVDAYLLTQANNLNVPVLSLESMQFQIDMLASDPDVGQEMLTSMIEDFDHSEHMAKCLIKSWIAGDKAQLEEFAQLTKMSPDFEQAFLIDRNLDWATKLSSPNWLPNANGSYVIVVGALHLVGKHNLIELLQAQGFEIEQLAQTAPAGCEFKY